MTEVKVIEAPVQHRAETNKSLVEEACNIAEALPDIQGFAIVAWAVDADGYWTDEVSFTIKGFHPRLLSALVKELIDEKISE